MLVMSYPWPDKSDRGYCGYVVFCVGLGVSTRTEKGLPLMCAPRKHTDNVKLPYNLSTVYSAE